MPQSIPLVNLLVTEERAEQLKQDSEHFSSITLSKQQLCDLEMLINGAMSPLTGYMDQENYQSVVDNCRLADQQLWPIPIVLDINESTADSLKIGDQVALRDTEGFMPAVLTISDIWQADKQHEAEAIYGTQSIKHPGVDYLINHTQSYYVGGAIEAIEEPSHFDFEHLWLSPKQLRASFKAQGWRNVIAFQTSRPIHKLQHHITLQAAREAQAHILLHPVAGVSKPGDLDYYARVHCYQAIQNYYPKNMANMSLLPMAMRMAGPREALWHALINRNYGCSHIIIGPDHASPPSDCSSSHKSFYSAYAAQDYVLQYAKELDIEIIAIEENRYVASQQTFLPLSTIQQENYKSDSFFDHTLKNHLHTHQQIPSWFSYPEVIKALSRAYPTRCKQGFTLFFTGLSGSGKSTLAKIIYAKMIELGTRPVTLLDGDIVRHNLSSELGFSKKDRNINVRRISFVANEISKNGGIAICAPIAPYTQMRSEARNLIEQYGVYIEIHVATPLEVCESRDRKGLYAKARKGIIPEFTGISDPYETPEAPELTIDTSSLSPMEAAQKIYLYLLKEGFINTTDACHNY